jgi:hypothetical protein
VSLYNLKKAFLNLFSELFFLSEIVRGLCFHILHIPLKVVDENFFWNAILYLKVFKAHRCLESSQSYTQKFYFKFDSPKQ